jgi:nitronate monooxygenase
MSAVLDRLGAPIVAAPMAGGPTTPELVAAVASAGGLGFLAAGYKTAEQVADDIDAVQRLTDAPFGVNVFVPGPPTADRAAIDAYAARLSDDAARLGVELGEPRYSDDDYSAKLALLRRRRVAVVSTTFGLADASDVALLQAAGSEVWATVTSPAEAERAARIGVDALVAQGMEAGAHRSGGDDADEYALLPLLRLLAASPATAVLPVVAAGGIVDGAGVAAALVAGAAAVQLGTAFLRCPEAGTSEPHRQALARAGQTRLTRAFTGRRARGIVNRFIAEHDDEAPRGYPETHFVTSPLRAAARAAGDGDALHLWAGQAYPLAPEAPAGDVVALLMGDARIAAEELMARLRAAAVRPGHDASRSSTTG